MARSKKARKSEAAVSDYRYDEAKRKNIPPAGLAAQGRVAEVPKLHYAYDPHLPPILRFDPTGATDYLDDLIGRAIGGTLSEEDGALLRELLGDGRPWLEWAGKREAQEFLVDPVALHIHERVSAQAILSSVRREDVQKDLFADPKQDYRESVRFYQHDVDWANRIILGDSLQVMASLAHREDLAGKVQMIYMDPPYGIKFASNFQPEIGKLHVRDREQDLTREPEMVKAYRDTWTLGVHSYLSYLRQRLLLVRELLADSGSIFVQIGDENLHRVRAVMDEVFGPDNWQSTITVQKTGGLGTASLRNVADHVLWYARDASRVKYRQLFHIKRPGIGHGSGQRYDRVMDANGATRRLPRRQIRTGRLPETGRLYRLVAITSIGANPSTSFPFDFRGRVYSPPSNRCWSTNREGMGRAVACERVESTGRSLNYVYFLDDYPAYEINNVWTDISSPAGKIYVVQTHPRLIERCLLMTTDPGDLVLDPTCGSGTTAYVAEQWGRRWITIDTSRVALALARQRLLTATYPHYAVKDDDASDGKADPGRGFIYKTVPHITLKSIAQNVALDRIFDRHQKVLDQRLATLNTALRKNVTPDLRKKLEQKLKEKQRAEGKRAITDGDRRRWVLPENDWEEWQVPFDADDEWPRQMADALAAYRKAWREKMDEVNQTIAAGASQEDLVDQPEVEKGVTRVSGPFTTEGVMPAEFSADGGFAGAPEEGLETFEAASDDAEAYVDRMLQLLSKSGVRFPDNRDQPFVRLDRIDAGFALQGEGEWGSDGGGKLRRVVVSLGPEYGPVTALQVEEAAREANRRGADDLVFAGFAFDGAAQAAIQDDPNPHVRMHLAHIAPDVEMKDLLKTTRGSQLFTVFGEPRTKLTRKGEGWVIEMQGVDIYDPVSNTIHPTRADRVAAWFLDSDYDGRTFCITQAFFPDRSAWEKLERALRGTIDEDRIEALSGTTSLPFKAGSHKRVAVKVIDPRGNDVMRVHRLRG
jgi:adenine-specific DNA-methyltransferase